MAVKVKGKEYLSYSEQIAKNKGDIEDLLERVKELEENKYDGELLYKTVDTCNGGEHEIFIVDDYKIVDIFVVSNQVYRSVRTNFDKVYEIGDADFSVKSYVDGLIALGGTPGTVVSIEVWGVKK